jgi:hypothetical protein
LNSYAPQIWSQPYVYHNTRKYEVTSLIVMHKHIFYSLFGWKKQDISKISKEQQLTYKQTSLNERPSCGRTNLNYIGSSTQVLSQGLQRTSNGVTPWPVG